jgi:hypothetical protein
LALRIAEKRRQEEKMGGKEKEKHTQKGQGQTSAEARDNTDRKTLGFLIRSVETSGEGRVRLHCQSKSKGNRWPAHPDGCWDPLERPGSPNPPHHPDPASAA